MRAAAILQIPWAVSELGWFVSPGSDTPVLEFFSMVIALTAAGLAFLAVRGQRVGNPATFLWWTFAVSALTGAWVLVSEFFVYLGARDLLLSFDLVGALSHMLGLYSPVPYFWPYPGEDVYNFLTFASWLGRLASTAAAVLLFLAARRLSGSSRVPTPAGV